MHLLSPAIQEFAEVRSQFDALHPLLGFDPAQTDAGACRLRHSGGTAELAPPLIG